MLIGKFTNGFGLTLSPPANCTCGNTVLPHCLRQALLAFAMLFIPLAAWSDRPIDEAQLPEKARAFIAEHFKGQSVAFAKEDVDDYIYVDYDVFLTDGTKIEFDRNGSWKEVKNRMGTIPATVIPPQIAAYIGKYHPEAKITCIEKERASYEVKLDIHLEIMFSHDFRVLGYDD